MKSEKRKIKLIKSSADTSPVSRKRRKNKLQLRQVQNYFRLAGERRLVLVDSVFGHLGFTGSQKRAERLRSRSEGSVLLKTAGILSNGAMGADSNLTRSQSASGLEVK